LLFCEIEKGIAFGEKLNKIEFKIYQSPEKPGCM